MNAPSFEGRVRSLSSEGLGVVEHPDGRVFFVPGVWPGDLAEFAIERVERRYGYGRLLKMIEGSPDRVTPPCPHQGHLPGSCGGCPWMIGAYPSQLFFKEQRLRHALERAKFFAATVVKPIIGSEPMGYRNRAQFKTDGEVLGFVSEGSHHIAPIQDCLVLTGKMRALLRSFVARLPKPDWKPGAGHGWNFIDADEDLGPESEPALNRRRNFRQGNSAQNERMREWLRASLREYDPGAPVVELFAGSGNFTDVLSSAGFSDVRAFEVSRESVAGLNERKLPGVRAFATDLFHPAAQRTLARESRGAGLLVLDPPRAGCKGIESVAQGIGTLKGLLYISCDVATFVRDAQALSKSGFDLKEVQPLDMFPQTPHLEVLAEFVRRP